ncbi:RidA family protein [Bacillus sp. 1NLA3E]|uniref:RidA family protein n=1 Tax=Bacillus sp. 1NLA3E TaxID=666686 RepID=UPI000247EFC9|nr:Rid family detoxifying hydrolase [Bacillus sp. 1NLA3E]AGK55580.1 endoribonuclease L-PSP [Bacillus sp. 1NLA3E]
MKKYPEAIGPYSAFRITGNLIFTSGQLPINPETNEFPSNKIEDQTRQSLLNVKAILEENGCTMDNIIKTTVYLHNMNDFNAMNEAYKEFFVSPYPGRTAVAVEKLPKNALVEIEVIAVLDK